jgi:Zn finger protein HypA/HybF involved in hydrogenase expression
MNLNDTNKNREFIDSVCTCRSCDHKIASECIKSNCSCCKGTDHSMVLDGMEGFMTKEK